MGVIINSKELRGRPIVQLERAAGAAIQYFQGAHGINVPRTRFLPVKGIPDVLELDHLTVSGDVTIGKNVTLKGTVIIVANHGNRIDIPDGAILENKVVSGNLRILDH